VPNPKAVNPKWRAVGVGIVPCGACGKDNEVIYRLRNSGPAGDLGGAHHFIYRCLEHTDITSLTDPKQVEW
jgi:hypothetical protein